MNIVRINDILLDIVITRETEMQQPILKKDNIACSNENGNYYDYFVLGLFTLIFYELSVMAYRCGPSTSVTSYGRGLAWPILLFWGVGGARGLG